MRLLIHLGGASATCKIQRPPDPWHLQKERGGDLKYILCQDAYRETRSPKYSWAEMTKQQPVLFLFSWEKFPQQLVNPSVSANSRNVQDLKVLRTRVLICSDRMCLQILPRKTSCYCTLSGNNNLLALMQLKKNINCFSIY